MWPKPMKTGASLMPFSRKKTDGASWMKANKTMKFAARSLMAGAVASAVAVLSGCAMNQTADTMKAGGHEYVLTVSRPNVLSVIDTETDTVVRSCKVPGVFGSGSIVSSPDGSIAYVMSNGYEDIYGFDIRNCDLVFSAKQSTYNLQVKSIISLTLSNDGKELYTVQNPTRKYSDHFEVQPSRLAVFETADGLNAKAKRYYPVDRRITKLGTLASGEVILGGGDLKAIDPTNGNIRMLSKLQNWERPADKWSPPDAFSMMAQGEHVGQYIMPYSVAKWNGEPGDMEKAEFWWGWSRVDLATGKVEREEIVPFTHIMFNMITHSKNSDIVYGAYNDLVKFDRKQKKNLVVKELPHTYYTVNMTRDGSKLYVGGTSSDISIHDPDTLEKIGSVQVVGDMGGADMRIVRLMD